MSEYQSVALPGFPGALKTHVFLTGCRAWVLTSAIKLGQPLPILKQDPLCVLPCEKKSSCQDVAAFWPVLGSVLPRILCCIGGPWYLIDTYNHEIWSIKSCETDSTKKLVVCKWRDKRFKFAFNTTARWDFKYSLMYIRSTTYSKASAYYLALGCSMDRPEYLRGRLGNVTRSTWSFFKAIFSGYIGSPPPKRAHVRRTLIVILKYIRSVLYSKLLESAPSCDSIDSPFQG